MIQFNLTEFYVYFLHLGTPFALHNENEKIIIYFLDKYAVVGGKSRVFQPVLCSNK